MFQKKSIFEVLQQEWVCPITNTQMDEPVLTVDGHSYEKQAIKTWLKESNKSPTTGLTLPIKLLVPNLALKSLKQRVMQFKKYRKSTLNRIYISNKMQKKQNKQQQKVILQQDDLVNKQQNTQMKDKVIQLSIVKQQQQTIDYIIINKQQQQKQILQKKQQQRLQKKQKQRLEMKYKQRIQRRLFELQQWHQNEKYYIEQSYKQIQLLRKQIQIKNKQMNEHRQRELIQNQNNRKYKQIILQSNKSFIKKNSSLNQKINQLNQQLKNNQQLHSNQCTQYLSIITSLNNKIISLQQFIHNTPNQITYILNQIHSKNNQKQINQKIFNYNQVTQQIYNDSIDNYHSIDKQLNQKQALSQYSSVSKNQYFNQQNTIINHQPIVKQKLAQIINGPSLKYIQLEYDQQLNYTITITPFQKQIYSHQFQLYKSISANYLLNCNMNEPQMKCYLKNNKINCIHSQLHTSFNDQHWTQLLKLVSVKIGIQGICFRSSQVQNVTMSQLQQFIGLFYIDFTDSNLNKQSIRQLMIFQQKYSLKSTVLFNKQKHSKQKIQQKCLYQYLNY